MHSLIKRCVSAACAAGSPALAIQNAIKYIPLSTTTSTSSSSSSNPGNRDAPDVSLQLSIAGHTFPIKGIDEIVLLAAGKAAGNMVEAAVDALKDGPISIPIRGLLVTKYGHHTYSSSSTTTPPLEITSIEAGHPTPDAEGEKAAAEMLSLAASTGPRSLVLVLLSGGGSSLLPLPAKGLTLTDLQLTNDALLGCGATIDEVNCVRKHLSRISGGRLALAAANAHAVVTLALSDVIGDRADVIASGPTTPDPTTFQDAIDVLERYGLLWRTSSSSSSSTTTTMTTQIPLAVHEYLEAGRKEQQEMQVGEKQKQKELSYPESPKTLPPHVAHFALVGGNTSALAAVAHEIAKENSSSSSINNSLQNISSFYPYILTSSLQGESKDAGKMIASLVHGTVVSSNNASNHNNTTPFHRRPAALIFGGETTVTFSSPPPPPPPPTSHSTITSSNPIEKGPGKGGRNMELALSAAVTLANLLPPTSSLLQQQHRPLQTWSIVAFGTDGTDGPTDAAGACVTHETIKDALAAGLDARVYLANHDSYTFFEKLSEWRNATNRKTNDGDGGGGKDIGELTTNSNDDDRSNDKESNISGSGGGVVEGSVCIEKGGLIITGPTGTNVMDVTIAFV